MKRQSLFSCKLSYFLLLPRKKWLLHYLMQIASKGENLQETLKPISTKNKKNIMSLPSADFITGSHARDVGNRK